MAERIPPHSENAERSVLGAIMLDENAMYEAMDILTPDDFYLQKHRELFDAAVSLRRLDRNVDLVTMTEELTKRGHLDLVGGAGYISSLTSDVPSTSNTESYAEIIREKSMLRKLIRASSSILDESYDAGADVNEVLATAEREILDISRIRQKRDYRELTEILWENLNRISDRAGAGDSLVGLTTGFQDLDAKTSGLQRSDLIIVAARPSMGKTSFALCLAQNAALKGGAHVAIFSLEMSAEQIGERMLSMEASVELSKLRTGELSRVEWDDLSLAVDRLAKASVVVDDTPGISISEIKSKCRRIQSQHSLDLIVIDYLQLMSIKGFSEGRQLEVSTLSRMLKQLAREVNCPVVVLSQLSRAVEQRQDHRPQLSDLRESGAIEQDADIVMFLYRDEYYNPDTTEKPNIAEINIAKQRNGPTGVVELAWLGKYTKFADKSPIQI